MVFLLDKVFKSSTISDKEYVYKAPCKNSILPKSISLMSELLIITLPDILNCYSRVIPPPSFSYKLFALSLHPSKDYISKFRIFHFPITVKLSAVNSELKKLKKRSSLKPSVLTLYIKLEEHDIPILNDVITPFKA